MLVHISQPVRSVKRLALTHESVMIVQQHVAYRPPRRIAMKTDRTSRRTKARMVPDHSNFALYEKDAE